MLRESWCIAHLCEEEGRRTRAPTGHIGDGSKRTPLRLKKGIHRFESVGFSLALFLVEISPRQSFCKLPPDDSQTF